jgi:integrase
LYWAGPASKKLKWAADLYADPETGMPRRHPQTGRILHLPWLDPPAIEEDLEERIFTPAEVTQWLEGCVHARTPVIAGVPPWLWWDSLVRVLYYTGLRIGAALQIRYSMIRDDLLDAPKEIMKGRRAQKIWLSPPAREAIEAIRRPGRDLIFPWPYHRQHLDVVRRKLLADSGIPPERRFGFHGVRKCTGDALTEIGLEYAQHALGHRSSKTTAAHYARKKTLAKKAFSMLPELIVARPGFRKTDETGQQRFF